MTASFPITSALAMLSGITDQIKSGRIRSSVDVGPAIHRRRYTAAVRATTVPVSFTDAEYTTFNTFYLTTLAQGTLSFNWTDPVGGATITMRFTDDPQFTEVAGGSVRTWTATFALEILP